MISTTNMTGFLISSRGSSLRNACGRAARSRSGSRTPRGRGGGSPRRLRRRPGSRSAGSGACRGRGRRTKRAMRLIEKAFPAFWRSCSTIGPSGSAGKNVSAPTMITTPMSRTRPEDARGRERAERRRDAALGGHRAGQGEDRDDHPVAADEHRERPGDVVEGRVAGQPGEGRAVVAGLAGERVQDLAEAVRAGVQRPGRALRQ